MALINPSNLYSAGQVVFDSTPYMRVALQREARKQALDDTLYKYYSELPNKINPAGVRTIDQDGLNNRLQGIRDFWGQNSKEVVKGGAKKQELDAMFQDAKQYIQQSKDTGLFQTKTGADYFKGKHRPRARDLEIMAAIERPIDDPTHYKNPDIKQPYSYNDFSIAAPDFDANRQQSFDKALLGKTEPQILPGDKPRYDTDTFEVIYNKKYRPEDVFNIAEKAAENIKGDISAYNFYEDQLDNPDAVKKASEALSKMAGVQVIAETPEQMAAGLKADQFMNFSKEDRRKDVAAVNEYKRKDFDYKEGIRQKNRKEMARLNDVLIKGRKTASGEEEYEVGFPTQQLASQYGQEIEIDPNAIVVDGKKGDPRFTGKRIIVFAEDIPEPMMQTINPTDLNKMIYPVEGYGVKKDGKIKEGFIYNPETGDLEGKDGRRIGNDVSRDLYIKTFAPTKFKFGAGAKGVMTKPGDKQQTKPKKDPLKLF